MIQIETNQDSVSSKKELLLTRTSDSDCPIFKFCVFILYVRYLFTVSDHILVTGGTQNNQIVSYYTLICFS